MVELRKGGALVALMIAGGALAACHPSTKANPEQSAEASEAASVTGTKQTVLDAVGKDGNLKTFANLVKDSGLEKALGGVGDYTVLAPTDAAWAKVPDAQKTLYASKDGRPQLLAMLRQHIVTGYVTRQDLDKALAKNGGAVTMATMGGAPVRLHRSGNDVIVGAGDAGPKLAGEATAARNGVIYPIDQVISPPPAPAAK